ncbi:family 78 glycoside hydrolase catalytic domain [Actinoallomurus sp. CA-142502]|uniref:family 78 glycoside hydrolase catalytic domain n=1 Tax=Actinoallomurus sp. CA-142502 TaxID=3239885 RepID=UPI003D8E4FD7
MTVFGTSGFLRKATTAAGILTGTVALTSSVSAPAGAEPPGSVTAAGLRADGLSSPLGIDDPAPALSWRLASHERGAAQTGYEIRAASSESRLAHPDLWDSGRVASTAVGAAYGGPAPGSRSRVFWQVRVWDGHGRASAWSTAAHWETGLLKPGDWTAKWLANPEWTGRQPTPVAVSLPAQTARYVRLDVTRLGLPIKEGWPYKVSRLQLAEIAVTDASAPGTDLALGAPVTATDVYTAPGQWEPRFVTDGSLTTDKAPFGYTSLEHQDQDLTTPIDVTIDLGAARHFDRILLYPRTDTLTDDGRTPNFPENFTVQASGDGTAFATAATVKGQEAPPPMHGRPGALPVFAKDFAVTRKVRSARLYATGLGVIDASVNGRPVGDAVLEPPNTDYADRVVYSTYDVTRLLRHGANRVSADVGNGMANVPSTPGRYEKLTRSDGAPEFLGQLEITYTDGSRTTIATDSSWRTGLGATTFTNWYGGEDYDARRAPGDWTAPVEVASPTKALTARADPPIEVTQTLHAKKISEPKPGVYVVDLGTNFAGWERLRVSGPAGTKVTMRPGELLNSDGTVSQATTGSPIWDTYTLSGKGMETWHPRFAYHGFRYLQVEGLPAAPDEDTVTGLVLRAANDTAGTFTSSNPLINDIHTIIDRAIQSNMYSVLTDCPHREKLGWLEEDNLVFGSVARNYDVAAYYRELVRNMAEAQTADGLVPDIAPEYTVFSGGFRDDPNWGGSLVLAPWQLYETYGDTATMRAYYPNMQRYLDYLTSKATGDLLDYGLGDWITFDDSTPVGVTASFGYYRIASAMSGIARVLGKADDARRYAALATRVGAAFNDKYLKSDTYASGSQASDALALDMGVVPADQRQAVLDHLTASIKANGYHLTVGEIALPSVFRVLSAAGRDDLIYTVATQTGNPSYGYQVTHGATSLTENWDGPTSGNSQNHFMLGAIDEWFGSGLAGIGQADGSVAFEHLRVRPAVVGDLTHAAASYETPRGTVASSWNRSGSTLRLDVTVPPGAPARVEVPLLGGTGRPRATPGATWIGVQDGRGVFEVGSGHWTFTATAA